MISRFSLFWMLGNRLLKDKQQRWARPIVKICTIGVTLGVIVMIFAMSIGSGYQTEIRNKVISMGTHIRISNYDNNLSFEPVPFFRYQAAFESIKDYRNVKAVQYFATKAGVIKTDDQVEGIIFKGIDSTFYTPHFQSNIIAGEMISFIDSTAGKDIVISSYLAKKLNFKLGDKVRAYFVQKPIMQRSFTISGIYETAMPDFDYHFAFVDLRHIQKLNQWGTDSIGGIEIIVENDELLNETSIEINNIIGYQLKAETIREIYPNIFEWIALFDTNVLVLLIITALICVITMMSTFFIIVLEQTSNIGLLKTMGIKNLEIIPVFLILAGKILLKGILLGTSIALFLCYLQQYKHFIKLDPAQYYVSFIPIEIHISSILLVNVILILLCLAILVLPAYYVAKKMSPINAIRLD